ncbi:MAG: hypothetical protein HQM08_19205 [Candidatus Riflebacteria bacterium]|nr:hypothetical protein [Candidatus Riflebacteria bacterium]
MNQGLSSDHTSIQYDDGGYPSLNCISPENGDATTEAQGISRDLARFQELAASTEGSLLELCCDAGRQTSLGLEAALMSVEWTFQVACLNNCLLIS